jgi:hypothetical protein
MMRLALPIIAAALVAVPIQAITIANPASDQLARLSVIARKGAMRKALLDSGVRCGHIEKVAIQGPWANTIMWRAKCGGDPRYDYAVFIGPDASVQVRYCAEMEQLHLPRCRPFSNNPPAPIILGKVPKPPRR